MDVHTIQKKFQQQKQMNIYLADNQCQLYGFLIMYKTSMHYIEDCMKNFCSSLREHDVNLINFEKKKMPRLTKKN